MPGFLVQVGATATCLHGGQVTIASSNTRVVAGGSPVATVADQFTVVGCPFTVPPGPRPCVQVKWLVPAARVRVNGQPVVLQTSSGVGVSAEQLPQGPPRVIVTQGRVRGI